MTEPTRATYSSQTLSLNAWHWGDPANPPLLLVHGGLDHARSWDWIARELAADWHVVAPDLRGHGDSDWASASGYPMMNFVYDLGEIVRQLGWDRFTLVGHSLGGNIALRYAGLFPDRIERLVSIEGLGPSPDMLAKRVEKGIENRLRDWFDDVRVASGRSHRAYASVADAEARMRAANAHLSEDQVRHLTEHGLRRDGEGGEVGGGKGERGWRWKFDPMIRAWCPLDITQDEIHALWGKIACPTWLAYGGKSWASNPAEDGRDAYFSNAHVTLYEEAGHWLHHDAFDAFMADLRSFIG